MFFGVLIMKNKTFKKIVSITLSTLIALPCVANFNPNNNISAIDFEDAQRINALSERQIFTPEKVTAINAYIEEHKNGTNIDVNNLGGIDKFELLAALWFDFKTAVRYASKAARDAAHDAALRAAKSAAGVYAWYAASIAFLYADGKPGGVPVRSAAFARAWLPGGKAYEIITTGSTKYDDADYNNLIKVLIEQIGFLNDFLSMID